MSFRLANIAGRAALVDGEHYYDLESVSGGSLPSDPMAAVAAHGDLHAVAAGLSDRDPSGTLADAHLEAPVPAPKNCFAIGLNYADHAAESSMELPEVPLTFTKFPGCIVGANADVVLNSEAADYEAEVVVVIGEGGRDIAAADAWNHIAGVTGGQDISDRALQFAAKPPHFDLGKSRDTYGPVGPVLVSPDLLDDPNAISIECKVNGEVRQSSSTSMLIFDVPALVEYLSSILTLHTGDLIFTGTPDGVGASKLMFLKPGDVIETSIGGVGDFANTCV